MVLIFIWGPSLSGGLWFQMEMVNDIESIVEWWMLKKKKKGHNIEVEVDKEKWMNDGKGFVVLLS